MKKRIFLQAIFALTILLTGLSSCKKIWDEIKQHPNGKGDNCRVENIYFTGYYTSQNFDNFIFNDTANFKYNGTNQLVSVDYASTKYHYYLSYPPFNYYFKYDNSGRLQAYLENYTQDENITYALFWHKYTHVSATQIIDSVYSYANGRPSNSATPETGDLHHIVKITLDTYGRVIKDEYASDFITYNYDGAGNLITPGVTYTSKTSIFQTNKTMMFIARDYSVNTQVGEATQYNSNQLPVKFTSQRLRFFVTQGFVGYDQNISVSYKCK